MTRRIESRASAAAGFAASERGGGDKEAEMYLELLQAVTFVMFEKETADVWRRVAEARGMSLASS